MSTKKWYFLNIARRLFFFGENSILQNLIQNYQIAGKLLEGQQFALQFARFPIFDGSAYFI